MRIVGAFNAGTVAVTRSGAISSATAVTRAVPRTSLLVVVMNFGKELAQPTREEILAAGNRGAAAPPKQ